jgi:hypothetical protein
MLSEIFVVAHFRSPSRISGRRRAFPAANAVGDFRQSAFAIQHSAHF